MSSLQGLDELLANLSGLGGNIKESSRIGLERAAKRIQANAKYLCPSNDGHLKNSIKTKSQVKEDVVEAQVFSNLDYATYVNFRYWGGWK